MKIALLSPAGAMHRHSGNFGKSLHYAPLTLTTLAAGIDRKYSNDIKIFDETIESIPLDIDADIIGITTITGTAPRCYKYSEFFRKKGIPVIMGGTHPTLMPYESTQYCDSVVIGQGEFLWDEILKDFKNNNLKKIYNGHKPYEKKYPIPKRDLMDMKKFITGNSIEATKGCVNDCFFCAVYAVNRGVHYKREVKDVIMELEKMKGKNVIFVDVNLVADKEYAKILFKEMIPLKKWWFGLSTADVINDEELFKIMIKSGCKGLLIGFEAVNESSLSEMNKNHNKKIDYSYLMKKMHDNGISVNGTFCFGTDSDNKDVFKRTVDKVIELKIDLPRYSIMTPFPGTKLYETLESENRIFERNWAMYDVQHCVFKPKNMSPQELDEGNIWAWEETYKNLSIAKRILRFDIMLPIAILTNIGYKNYAKKLRYFDRNRMTDNSDIRL